MNRRSFLKRASLAVGAAAISLSMLRAPKPKKQPEPEGLTLEKLMKARDAILQNEPHDGVYRMAVASQRQLDRLVADELVKGDKDPFGFGFKWVKTEKLT